MHEFTVLAVFGAIVGVWMAAFLLWEKLYMKDPPHEDSPYTRH